MRNGVLYVHRRLAMLMILNEEMNEKKAEGAGEEKSCFEFGQVH